MSSHPFRVPGIRKHAIKHKIHVSHLHRRPATKQDTRATQCLLDLELRLPGKVRWGRARGGERGGRPVKEEHASDHLVGVGPGPSSPHLLSIQVIKHTLPKETEAQVNTPQPTHRPGSSALAGPDCPGSCTPAAFSSAVACVTVTRCSPAVTFSSLPGKWRPPAAAPTAACWQRQP